MAAVGVSLDLFVGEPSRYLSFVDGDIVLRSKNGIEFRVDATILRRASGLFHDMLKLSSMTMTMTMTTTNMTEANPVPIDMEETADVLDDLLRMIYPTPKPCVISSDQRALELLIAVERLQVSSHAVNTVLSSYLSAVEPPLRAWALAVRFDYPHARHTAVKRFIAEKKDYLSEDIPELESVGARSVLRLLRIKRDALEAAHTAVTADSFVWYCQHHAHMTWRTAHSAVISTNPFDPVPMSDAVLVPIVKATACPNCVRRCQHESTAGPRTAIRRMVGELLDSAGTVEATKAGIDVVAGLAIPEIPAPPGPMPPPTVSDFIIVPSLLFFLKSNSFISTILGKRSALIIIVSFLASHIYRVLVSFE